MCAHIGQNRHIYPLSIYGVYFDSWHPLPLLRRLTVGAAIEKNFFSFLWLRFRIFFLTPLSTRSNYTSIFIFFQILARIHRMFGLRIFFFEFYTRYSYLDFFLFFQNIASTRQVFTRYSLSAFIFSRFILVWLRFGVYFISLRIMASI